MKAERVEKDPENSKFSFLGGGDVREYVKMPMPAKGNWRNTATIYTFLVGRA